MTRSSWHCFWMLLTYGSLVAFIVFFLLALTGNHNLQIARGSVGDPLADLALQRLAADLAALLAVFWGTVAIFAGTAWYACNMALSERKAYNKADLMHQLEQQSVRQGMGVDVNLRA